MSEPIKVIMCSHVGAQGGDDSERIVLKDFPDWEISSPLYIMGHEAGVIVGRGKKHEEAEADIERQLHEAADSLWADE
jgi:hypothetical protein